MNDPRTWADEARPIPVAMSDQTLRGSIAHILDREGATASAAEKIQRLMRSEQRLVPLKVAPSELNLSTRTFYRRLKAGLLRTVETPEGRMVDVGSKLAARENCRI
ncbi:MAG: hypothetical protein LV480_03935 [Methylacidiphilales bacterium]|nr:hypothetical protein [Candidatus Methylacidiphilales bacterium]